jgi:hypothetical protein
MPVNRRYHISILAGLFSVLPLCGQNSVDISCPNQSAPGASAACSLALSLSSGISVDSLTLGVAVTPGGGAPALTQGQLSFGDAVGGAFSSSGGTNNAISVVWFDLRSPLSGAVPLGVVGFAIPAAAVLAQGYTVTLTGASASLAGEVVSLAVGPPAAILIETPTVVSVSPTSGQQSQTLVAVAIAGQNTSFTQGTTAASFGLGITVTGLTVTSPTAASANVLIASNAALGSRNVTMTTGSEVATLTGAFTVLAGACDVNNATSTNVSSVQAVINQVLGTAPSTNDLNGDGKVNIVDLQVVINAALGLGCSASG